MGNDQLKRTSVMGFGGVQSERSAWEAIWEALKKDEAQINHSMLQRDTYRVGVDIDSTKEGHHGDGIVTSARDLLVLRNFVLRIDRSDGEALSDFQCVSNGQTEQLSTNDFREGLTDVSDQLESDL